MLRRIVLVASLAVIGVVPVAFAMSADPFGSLEIVDPKARPYDGATGVLGADPDGNAYFLSWGRNQQGQDQPVVFERCGATAARWKPTPLGPAHQNFFLLGMRVGRDGTAMAVWRNSDAQGFTFYSSTKPPGGAWGEPQVIVADPNVNFVQFAMSDSGDAVASWQDSSPASTRVSIRLAGEAWGPPETVVSAARDNRVAMSATGDVMLLTNPGVPAKIESHFRPAGGSFGAAQIALDHSFYQELPKQWFVEFDGLGRAVVIASYQEFLGIMVYTNVRNAGTWAETAKWMDDDGEQPANPFFGVRVVEGLVRHKDGAVAVWYRRPSTSSFSSQAVVSRLSGAGWEVPEKVFETPAPIYDLGAATNDAGEILLTGTVSYVPGGSGPDVTEVRGTIAPSISAPWPAITRLSPESTAAKQYRGEGTAAAAGNAFYAAWGVHGGSNERTEVIATRTAGCASTPSPTPTPTPTVSPTPTPTPIPTPTPSASATPAPNPLPLASPTPAPPAPNPPSGPSAIADFTTFPAASKCVRGRKLTVRLKRPPRGYTVKTVTIKVNGKRVTTAKGKALKKPLYLRKLPKGTFTVEVTIKLTKGKGLTERRRYTACK